MVFRRLWVGRTAYSKSTLLSVAAGFGAIGLVTLLVTSASTGPNIAIQAIHGLVAGNASTELAGGVDDGFVQLHTNQVVTPELSNPVGFIDSCTVINPYYTVLRGWAYDPQSSTGDEPIVEIAVSNSKTVSVKSSVANYRDEAVNAFIRNRSSALPLGNTYGFEATVALLNPFDNYTVSGIIKNVGAGTDQPLGINTAGHVDGDTSKPYFGANNAIPRACLPDPNSEPCQAPVTFPAVAGFHGHMNSTQWYFNNPNGVGSITMDIYVHDNLPTNADLYFQAYQAALDESGSTNFNGLKGMTIYYGIQTNGRIIFSLFGSIDTNNVRPSPGAYAVFGTNEGPYISLRMDMPSLPGGVYRTRLTYTEYDGIGDWYSYYITVPGGGEQSVGSIRFPRQDPARPVYLPDMGTSWTEYWANNNATGLLPVPTYNVSYAFVDAISAEGQHITPEQTYMGYYTMPNADNELLRFSPAWVRHRGGGSTQRCHGAGWVYLRE